MTAMRIVVALGGNALLKRGEAMTADVQARNVRKAVAALAPLILEGHQIVITHGNGPQVGLLASQAESGPAGSSAPLDVLDAESEGMIGYLIERELQNALPAGALTACLLTQITVDRRDPALHHPTKPIGPTYTKEVAEALASKRGWPIAADGKGWRRVAPSPQPQEILEARVIDMLVSQGVTVICAGGGGIPVIEQSDGSLRGVEAVIDKDLASALLARLLRADRLLLLTDVDAVYRDWGTPSANPLRRAAAGDLRSTDFASGSMGPKIEAACRFANETGRSASIGQIDQVQAILAGNAGTTISINRL